MAPAGGSSSQVLDAGERYGRGSTGLIAAVQELSMARSAQDVQTVVRRAARELTGADGATLVLRDDSRCYYVDEDAIAPLWKGQRFPLDQCISGWSMLNRQAAVIPDIYLDLRIPHDAYRPTFVRSLVMVPMREAEPIGAIGNYWADHHAASDEEVALLQALANSTAVAMENVEVYARLEARVAERTRALTEVVRDLEAEVERRREAEEEIRRLSVTDELTGLHNRRGFSLLANQQLRVLRGTGRRAVLLFIDLDGLKDINDGHGHDAGDAVLQQVAAGLAHTFRGHDIVARFGGDEFAVLVVDAAADAPSLPDRIRAAIGRALDRSDVDWGVSVGLVPIDPATTATLDELLGRADAAMYEDKQRGRFRR